MAKTRILREDTASADVFGNITDGAIEAKIRVDLLDQSLRLVKKSASTVKIQISNNKANDVKSIAELNSLTQKSIDLATNKLAIDKQLLKELELIKAQQKEINNNIREEVALEQKQIGSLGKLRAENSKLIKEREKLNLSTKEGARRLKEINYTLDANNRKIEQNTDKLGKQRIGIGRYEKSITSLRNGLGQLGLAFGIGTVVTDAFRTVSEFETQIADLSAVTGASGKELDFMSDKAIEFSKKYGESAASVAEAFKLAGSARPELLKNGEAMADLTEKAILLSKASGDDVTTSIANLAGTLNAFEMPASKASKVMDTLANAAQLGAQEIPYLTEAFTKFGGVAANAGIGVAESAAAVEILGKKIPEASTAGLNMKNVIIQLQVEAAKQGREFKGLTGELELLKPKMGDITFMTKLFSKENILAGQTLVKSTEELKKMTKELDKNGTTQEQASIKSKTMSEALKRLCANYDAFVLNMMDGVNASSILSSTLDFLAENLETIISVALRLIQVFITFKAVMASMNMIERIKEYAKFNKTLKETGKDGSSATNSVKDFGKSLKGAGIAFAITLLIELASKLYDVATGADVAEAKLRSFDRYKKGAAQDNKVFIDSISTEIEANNRMLELAVASGKMKAEQATKERLAFLQSKQFFREVADFQTRITKTEYFNIFDKIKYQVEDINRNIKLTEFSIKSLKASDPFKNRLRIGEEEGKVRALKESRGALWEYNKQLVDEAHNLKVAAAEDANGFDISKKGTPPRIKDIKTINTEFQNQIDLLEELTTLMADEIELQNQIDESNRQQEIEDINNQIEAEKELAKVRYKETGVMDNSKVVDLINQRKDLEIESITARRDAEIASFKVERDARLEELRKGIEEEHLELVAGAEGNAEALIEIEKNYQAELAKLEGLRLVEEEHLDQQILSSKTDANNEILKVEKKTEDEIVDLKIEANKEIEESEKLKLEKDKEFLKQRLDRQKEFIDLLTDYFVKKSDERIAKIEEEIDAAQKQYDNLQELANNGNITAKESLAEQNKIIAEANQQKEKEERRKQNIILASAVLQAYNSELANGASSGEAFSKAVLSTSLLSQFIQSLPTFLEGIEDTGPQGRGVDGKGGFLSVLHPQERVLTKEQNAKIGGKSNEEVARVMEKHRLGTLLDGAQLNVGFGNESLVKELMNVGSKLDLVNRTIENKPEMNIGIGEIVDGTMKIIASTKKGNSLVYNRFKVQA
jgi:TP901 family phage tail tape measure protein